MFLKLYTYIAEVDEEQMEGVQSPTKSDKSIGDDNLHSRDQEVNKSNQEEVGEREISHGDVLLHMPSFDTEPSTSGTQKSLPKKKLESPNVKKKVQKKKGGKGRKICWLHGQNNMFKTDKITKC